MKTLNEMLSEEMKNDEFRKEYEAIQLELDVIRAMVAANEDYRCSFETFKSNTCHHVKDMGDIDFIIETLETDEVRKLYERRWCREAMYLLAMIDYLSRMNDVPLCTNYNDIRSQKLEKLYFSAGVEVAYAATGDERIKEKALANAIPEFMRFNIVESEVRNVC